MLGSMTLDVVLRLDALPGRMEDANIHAQAVHRRLCLQCVSGDEVLRQLCASADTARIRCTQRAGSSKRGDPDILTVVAEEKTGAVTVWWSRTGNSFLSYGVEYHYPLAQLAQMVSALRFVYLCGIDLEEAGDEVLILLADGNSCRSSAPGPRVTQQGG
ncbi:MAG: hypothetical protein ACLVJ6_13495 [Merdibacter sp.]